MKTPAASSWGQDCACEGDAGLVPDLRETGNRSGFHPGPLPCSAHSMVLLADALPGERRDGIGCPAPRSWRRRCAWEGDGGLLPDLRETGNRSAFHPGPLPCSVDSTVLLADALPGERRDGIRCPAPGSWRRRCAWEGDAGLVPDLRETENRSAFHPTPPLCSTRSRDRLLRSLRWLRDGAGWPWQHEPDGARLRSGA